MWRGLLKSCLNNGHTYRFSGANALLKELEQLRQKTPEARIYIIGHSHGGNVALYAANKAPTGTVNGIIMLATPFFRVRPDLTTYDSFKSSFAVLDNIVVLPWIAMALAIVVFLAPLYGSSLILGAMTPLLPAFIVVALQSILGIASLGVLVLAYHGAIFALSAMMISIENAVGKATQHVTEREFSRIASRLPPDVPCRWIYRRSQRIHG